MTKIKDGQPCNHAGCLRHISHPCEECGRVAGRFSLEDVLTLQAKLEDMQNALKDIASVTQKEANKREKYWLEMSIGRANEVINKYKSPGVG